MFLIPARLTLINLSSLIMNGGDESSPIRKSEWTILTKKKKGYHSPLLHVTNYFINNQLVGPQASRNQNFKFLASQEVLHLLTVFDASLKEAKMTFLIPERIIFIFFILIII